MTYLAVPIAAKNLEQAEQQVRLAIAAGAEMLELRVDYLENLTTAVVAELIAETRASTNLPLIVTCRDKAEGGANNWPAQLRIGAIEQAINRRAQFVDCEWRNIASVTGDAKIETALEDIAEAKLILSAHSFNGPFKQNLRFLYQQISDSHADIVKLVYTANHINDCFDAFDLLHEARGDLIAFCMGQAGLISRILAKKLNSLVTFASIDDETATAPGQLTVQQFKQLYQYDSIKSDTELYGIIGSPVAHSMGPAIHNACFADAKLNKLYLPLLVEGTQAQFNTFMDNCIARPWLNFKGFSVTLPHKKNAIDYVRAKGGYIEPLAEKIGAANTIILDPQATSDERRICAYNTDYAGALDAITNTLNIERADLKNMPVAVIGAGGVSRAIVAALSDIGAKTTVYNRTLEKAERLSAEFGCQFAPLDALADLNAKLLINCTSIGMHPDIDASPLPADLLKADLAVFDTVYNPAQTLLLKQAAGAGAKTIDGVAMFVNQAAAQFKLFTNQNPNVELMTKTVQAHLGG